MQPPPSQSALDRFEQIYRDGPAWEIDRPQPVFIQLFRDQKIVGEVLDVGCGTGQLSVFLASQGLSVVGVEFVHTAIERAKKLAADANVQVDFRQLDALQLATLDRTFDTIVDGGLYHVFPAEVRGDYVQSLAAVAKPGTQLWLVCFSDHEPGNHGPLRMTEAEIRHDFKSGWKIDAITRCRYQVNERSIAAGVFDAESARAWLAAIRRI